MMTSSRPPRPAEWTTLSPIASRSRRLAESGARGSAQMLLWIGSMIGSAAVGMAVVSVAFGMSPLVFQSGSMAPAYETGDLGFAREVSADRLEMGDVVTVVDPDGVRVTHRIIAIVHLEGRAALTLKGDANEAADPRTVLVTSADRLMLRVPKGGLAIGWLMSPPGMLTAGILVGTLVFIGFVLPAGMIERTRRRRRVRRRVRRRIRAVAFAGVAALVATTVAAPGPAPTLAYWTDTADATTGPFAAYVVPPPTAASDPCSTSPVLTNTTLTLRWNGASPPGGGPALSDHQYVVTIVNRNTGAVLASDVQTHSGGAGSLQTRQYAGGLLAGLGLGTTPAQARIETRVAGTNWVSTQIVTINFNINTTLTVVSFSCG